MKTTKVILISAITSIVVLGLFMLIIHTMDDYWNDEDDDHYGRKECVYAKGDKEWKGKKEWKEKKKCKKHDAFWAELKVERNVFDEELSVDEKEIIAQVKAEHGDEMKDRKCCGPKRECSDECKQACESIDQIAENHMESLDAVLTKVHQKMSGEDDDEDGDIDEDGDDDEGEMDDDDDDDDDEMCKMKMERHKKKFVRHFLLMDF